MGRPWPPDLRKLKHWNLLRRAVFVWGRWPMDEQLQRLDEKLYIPICAIRFGVASCSASCTTRNESIVPLTDVPVPCPHLCASSTLSNRDMTDTIWVKSRRDMLRGTVLRSTSRLNGEAGAMSRDVSISGNGRQQGGHKQPQIFMLSWPSGNRDAFKSLKDSP
jgi:hypothetical protein